MTTTTTETFNFFHRAERSTSFLAKRGVTFDEFWADTAAHEFTVEVPKGTDLKRAFEFAYSAGLSRGSSRGGSFQVQCDRGIWEHIDSRRIDGAPAHKVTFKTWDEIEAEEAVTRLGGFDVSKHRIVVSYGMGLDSTATLVEMWKRGIRPDLIMFADTGGEKPETYDYLATINAWLRSIDFPAVTVVKYEPVRATYNTLEEKCLVNGVLVSLSFNQHQCALVFKRDVQVKYLKAWAQANVTDGAKILNVIGYDDSKADRKRAVKSRRTQDGIAAKIADRASDGKAPLSDQWQVANCEMVYPLQDWGLERPDLPAIVESVGLPVPMKSACFFCPASKPSEVVELKNNHPDLYLRAIEIEANAQPKLREPRGLGMGGWYWSDLEDVTNPDEAADFLKSKGSKVASGVRP